MLLPCDIDDRYTLTEELGHGSHAIVYRALDRHLDREVAVKVLREELVGSTASERFQREIRVTSRLEHPHIAHVYGTGSFMGKPYFVIALARGSTLGERLAHEHQLPVAEAIAIARQVGSALQHAHAAGIIHRDVKPENILLTPDGALLSDFGVARSTDQLPGTLATSAGTAVGTLQYMSPEQLCAEKDIDARCDQYALALVLYEMLAGVPAHVAANAEGLRGLRIVGQHAPVRAHRPAVPDQVDEAIQQALAPAPADRFTSMSAFIAALDVGGNSASYRVSATTLAAVHSSAGNARAAAATVRRRVMVGAAVAVAGSVMAWYVVQRTPRAAANPSFDSTSFTVVANGDTAVARALAIELELWSPDIEATVAGASAAKSGVVLETRVTTVPNGMRAAVQLRPASARSSVKSRTVHVTLPVAAAPRADSLRLLAARVLMARLVDPDSVELPDAVLEHPEAALRRYGEGWVALLAGNLPQADAAFVDAARTGSLPQAALWRTTVASWLQPKAPAAWRESAANAQVLARLLSRRDSLLGEALLYRASDRMPDSCDAYARATRIAGGSFAAWYGLGECLRVDSIVVLDRAASPSGARFRTSRWGAEAAYEEAIARLPSADLVHLFERLPAVTLALNGTKRVGMLPGDQGRKSYAGLPALSGDTVVVYPLPQESADAALPVPPSYQAAVRRLRARLLELTGALARRAPRNLAAQLTHANAFELAGVLMAGPGESALTVLQRALPLARTPTDSIGVRLAMLRIYLRLADFRTAGSVATTLLRAAGNPSPPDAERLAPVALLTGQRPLAESLVVRGLAVSAELSDGLPPAAASAVARYRVSAALGPCSELGAQRQAAVDALRNTFAEAERNAKEDEFLSAADWSRLPCAGASLPSRAPATDPFIRARLALNAGDIKAARRILQEMRSGRDGASAASMAWDTRFLELSMLLQAQDTAGAVATLGSALEGFSATMDYVLRDPGQAAGLRNSLAMCDALRMHVAALGGPGERCRDATAALRVTGRQ